MPRNYDRYAFPGGYEIFAVMTDGGILCIPCCNDESNPVHEDFNSTGEKDGWGIAAFDNMSNSEESVTCDHCNRVIS